MGQVPAVVEADAPRVRCPDPEHGVVVAAVPWARHRAGHTRGFDDQVAWLATQCSKLATCVLMRIPWRSVGAIVGRVYRGLKRAAPDPLSSLRRIGIDEVSYQRGRKYLTVITDHDTGRVVWAAPGQDAATLRRFFTEELGPARCAAITHITSDLARWIANAVAEHCPQAVRCADPFHVVAWAGEALDELRREVWNAAPGRRRTTRGGRGSTGPARALARARWTLSKKPRDLTDKQQAKLDWIRKTNPTLHRGWALKEGLRHIFALGGEDGIHALDRWLAWAQRCRIPQFVELGRRIKRHRGAIEATLRHGLSNALAEAVNTRIRLIIRRACGFHNTDNLTSLIMLTLGGYTPALPGR